MKKATIASIVLALLVAANAAAATNRVPIMKRKGGRKGALNLRGKRDNTCKAVKCIEKGKQCSEEEEDETELCNDDLGCVYGKCGLYVEGSPCSKYGYCDNNYKDEKNLRCNRTENKCHEYSGEGGACTYDGYECEYGLFCNAKDSTTPGVCVKNPTKAGDECGFKYTSCPGDLECYKGVCTERPTTVGAECDSSKLPCVGNNLICNSTDNKCAALPDIGEECLDSYFHCAGGLVCNYLDNKCAAIPKENETCINGMCSEGLICNSTDNKCAAIPKEGETCINGRCAAGLYCNSVSGKCANYPVAGEECLNSDIKCAAYHYCDSATNKCVEYPGVGEECYEDSYCGPELVCARDYDTEKRICRNNGEKGCYCDRDRPCNEGLLCNSWRNMCVEGECVYDEDCKKAYLYKIGHVYLLIHFFSFNFLISIFFV